MSDPCHKSPSIQCYKSTQDLNEMFLCYDKGRRRFTLKQSNRWKEKQNNIPICSIIFGEYCSVLNFFVSHKKKNIRHSNNNNHNNGINNNDNNNL